MIAYTSVYMSLVAVTLLLLYFKRSSNLFRNRIYTARFKRYLQTDMRVQKNFDLNTQNFKRTLKNISER